MKSLIPGPGPAPQEHPGGSSLAFEVQLHQLCMSLPGVYHLEDLKTGMSVESSANEDFLSVGSKYKGEFLITFLCFTSLRLSNHSGAL